MSNLPALTLNNGITMPALGLGVFLSKPEETATAVRTAIGEGYRLIDTAAAYVNERDVGEGLRESGIDRSEMFITTKLFVTQYGYDEALRAFDASMDRLGLDYLDLYLLHWPMPDIFDKTVASYKAVEKILAEGQVRAIGVCNFKPAHLDRLLAETEIVPTVNQIELHPYFTQVETREANDAHRIVTQSWSPIGGAFVRTQAPGRPEARSPLDHPVVVALAEKYGKTSAQIVIRWHLENGLSVIPKSVRADRIAENISVFDFTLTAHEIAAIDLLNTGQRAAPDPDVYGIGDYKVDIDNQ